MEKKANPMRLFKGLFSSAETFDFSLPARLLENTSDSSDHDPTKAAFYDKQERVIVFKDGKYRGAVSDETGLPQGFGEMVYNDGTVYEGQFNRGKCHLHGTLRFPDHSFMFGSWESDEPDTTSPWKIVYCNKDEFWGYCSLSKKEFNEHRINSVFVLKKKEGEMHYAETDDKFFGSWETKKHESKRVGYGILTTGKGEKYYGEWKDDMFHGQGVYFCRDGSHFNGRFNRGKRDGVGTMVFPNGDSIEGIWTDNIVQKATFTKGSWKNSCQLSLMLASITLPEGIRSQTEPNPSLNKWTIYFLLNARPWEDAKKKLTSTCKIDPERVKESFEEIMGLEFFQILIKFFKNSFHGSYFNSVSTSTSHDLAHARDDILSLTSVCTRQIGEVMQLRKNEESAFKSCLSTSLQTHVYRTLFKLYHEVYQEEDFLLNQRLKELQNVSLASVGVDSKFIPPVPLAILEPYSAAVRELLKMRTQDSAAAKIECLAKLRNLIINEMGRYRTENGHTKEWQAALDDICPVYNFVFIRAQDKVPDLRSNLAYINDFRDESIELDPVNSTLAFYEGFVNFAFEIDSTFRDDSGIVVPPTLISEMLERIVREEIQSLVRQNKPRPSFNWLPSLLLKVGLEIGDNKLQDDTLPVPEDLREVIFHHIDLVNRILTKSSLGIEIGFRPSVEKKKAKLSTLQQPQLQSQPDPAKSGEPASQDSVNVEPPVAPAPSSRAHPRKSRMSRIERGTSFTACHPLEATCREDADGTNANNHNHNHTSNTSNNSTSNNIASTTTTASSTSSSPTIDTVAAASKRQESIVVMASATEGAPSADAERDANSLVVIFSKKCTPHIYFRLSHHISRFLREMK